MEHNREEILAEIQRRCLLVPGMNFAVRNPKLPLDPSLYPATSILSEEDTVDHVSLTGDFPEHQRTMNVMVVPYIVASDEMDDELAETEINAFVLLVKKEIYRGDQANLGGKCSYIYEISMSSPLKPYAGRPGIGISITFGVRYLESISELFE